MIRKNLEHPYFPARKISQYPTPPPSEPRVLPMNQLVSPKQQHPLNVLPSNAKITFGVPMKVLPTGQQSNPNAPPFREIRGRYATIPSKTNTDVKSLEQKPVEKVEQKVEQESKGKSEVAQIGPKIEVSEVIKDQRSQQQMKYDKLRTQFDKSQKVFVDRKLNVKAVVQSNSEKVKITNNLIECIPEENHMLEESRTLFSQVQILKKKNDEHEDRNNLLRAQMYILQAQLAVQQQEKLKKTNEDSKTESQVRQLTVKLKESKERESLLQKQVKELQIELRRTQNESAMARINESEISKKCQLLASKRKGQEKEIQRLKELLSRDESLPQSIVKSETVVYNLN